MPHIIIFPDFIIYFYSAGCKTYEELEEKIKTLYSKAGVRDGAEELLALEVNFLAQPKSMNHYKHSLINRKNGMSFLVMWIWQ